MDSDLSEAVLALKAIFEKRLIPANFRANGSDLVDELQHKLSLPPRYAAFLKAADPLDVETATPPERVRFLPAAELEHEQAPMDGWRDVWVVIGHSALLGDPYFIDTSRLDAEGDCPVMTAMAGTDRLEPVMCASSFVTFIQILAAGMDIAEDFADTGDPDDEHIFKETLATRLRVIDPVALREGHWTS